MHARKALYVALAMTLPLAATAQPVPPPEPCAVDMLLLGQGGDGGEGGDGGSLGSMNIVTGDPAFLTDTAGGLTEIEYDIDTERLFATAGGGGSTIFWLDIADGTPRSTVPQNAFGALTGLEFVGGVLYGTLIEGGGGAAPSQFVTVNPDTGDIGFIGSTGFGPVSGLAYDEADGIMYGITALDGNLVTIDMGNGAGQLVGATGFDRVGSIEFDQNGVLWGVTAMNSTSPGATFTIDPQNGSGLQQGRAPVGLSGITSCASGTTPRGPQIPIPTMNTWGLIALGGLALFIGGAAIRRRRTWTK